MSLLPLFTQQRPAPPELTIKALLEFAGQTIDGALVEAVAIPWFEILEMVKKDPQSIYSIEPRTWEEIIAGAYSRAGFDEVILTPRSGDKGRDVVATKRGIACVRIFDQVKAYKPGNVVTAEDVRAMLGAPRLLDDEFLKPYIPYRLELKAREPLLAWLDELSEHKS